MPELPEVETIVRELRDCIIGKRVKDVTELRRGTIVNPLSVDVSRLGNIESIDRLGKYIIISFSSEYLMIIHLRMTGKLVFDESGTSNSKYLRAAIALDNSERLLFDDIRTFGKIELIHRKDMGVYFNKLGKDALSNQLSAAVFIDLLRKKKTNIKNFLLDQTIIAGLGNIYVNEILFRCGINPLKNTADISDSQAKIIYQEMKKVLREAIKCNGTTISDYRRVDDKQGSFQNFLRVYGKKMCTLGHKIEKIQINGRSTYFCPVCQKND